LLYLKEQISNLKSLDNDTINKYISTLTSTGFNSSEKNNEVKQMLIEHVWHYCYFNILYTPKVLSLLKSEQNLPDSLQSLILFFMDNFESILTSYTPARASFNTYISTIFKNKLSEYITTNASNDNIWRNHSLATVRKIRKAITLFEYYTRKGLDYHERLEAIAKELNIKHTATIERYITLYAPHHTHSLEEKIHLGDDDLGTLKDYIAGEDPSPEDIAITNEKDTVLKTFYEEFISILNIEEKRVFIAYLKNDPIKRESMPLLQSALFKLNNISTIALRSYLKN